MSVDSSIALQAKLPTFDNPLTQYAQVAAIQNAQQQNRLADLTYADKQREVSSDNALANLLAGGKTGDDVVTGLAAQGYGKNALGYAKTMQEQAKTKLEIQKQQSELIDAKLKQSRAYLDGVTTPEQYLAWHEANHKDPILGPALAARGVTAEQSRATINAAMQQPGGFDQLLNQSRMGIEKFAEANKPTVHVQNLGGTSQVLSTPGMGGAPTVLSTSPITQSPDSIASNSTSIRNTDAKIDAEKPPSGYRYNAAGNLEAIPGGPATNKPTEAQQKVGDANSVLSLLDMAEPLLKKSTSSLVGTGIDKLAQGVGVSTEGAQSAAQLKALEGALVSKMPKMSGPQSDKDVLLYRQMAGQVGDSTLPVETRQAAIKTIRELNQKYVTDNGGKYVTRTGKTKDGQKVVQYSDGSIEIAK